MTKSELESIIDGKAYLEYVGNLFEYDHTELWRTGNYRHFFLDVNDGHDIDFYEETLLNCPNHFQICTFDQVSH